MYEKFKKSKWLIFAFAFYFIGVATYAYKNYINSSEVQYERIGSKVTRAFSHAINQLYLTLGDNISGHKTISEELNYQVALELQEIAHRNNVKYIYTMIREGNDVFFISSNLASEEVEGTTSYDKAYRTPYEEVNNAIHETFNTFETHIIQYTNRWGRFYSEYTPFKDKQGRTYVMGIDIPIEEVQSKLQKASQTSLIETLLLGLLIFPIVATCIGYVVKFRRAKQRWLYTNNKTMLPNGRKLSEQLEKQEIKCLTLIRIENYDSILYAKGTVNTDNIIQEYAQRLCNFEYPDIQLNIYHVQDNMFAINTLYDPEKVDEKDAITKLFNRLVKIGYGTSGENPTYLTIRIGTVKTKGDALALGHIALSECAARNITNIVYEDGVNLPEHHISDLSHYSMLIDGINKERIVPFYQPIFRTYDKQIVKYEALARIIDDDYNIVLNPNDFIPIAYRSRLCHKITRLIVEHAIDDIENNTTQGFNISINISIQDLQDKETLNYITNSIKKRNVGHHMCFEILEDQKIEDYSQINKAIEKLRSVGCQIGLDDMGKHYSNFDRLFSMPLDFVKIDGEIISYVHKNDDALNLVKEIVNFAQSRNLFTIAEFCNNEETYELIKHLGIDMVQGYYLGRPRPLSNSDKT